MLPPRQRHASVEQSTFSRPSSVGSDSYKRSNDTSNLIDKQFNSFLESLWEKGNDVNQIQRKKRKLSSSEVDSTEDQDLSAANKEGTKLMKENALLAKLLSTKAKKENVVNTGISGNSNPCATPQSRLTKDISQKLLNIKPTLLERKGQSNQDSKVEAGSTSTNSESFLLGTKEMGQLKNPNQNTKVNKPSDLLSNFNSSSSNTGQDQNSQETYDNLHMLFSNQGNNVMEFAEVSESSDPLLNEILQQAEDLKQDLNAPQTTTSSAGVMVAPNNWTNSFSENHGMLSDEALLSQLEQVLNEKNVSVDEIDQLLGISNKASFSKPSGTNDMIAIEEIQKELMRDEPVQPNSSVPNPIMARTLQSQVANRSNFMQNMQGMNQVHGNGTMDLGFPHQQISPPNPQQGFQQPQSFGLQGPRLPGPQGQYTDDYIVVDLYAAIDTSISYIKIWSYSHKTF